MNYNSVYQVECICGEKLTSESRQIVCPKYGVRIQVDWDYEIKRLANADPS